MTLTDSIAALEKRLDDEEELRAVEIASDRRRITMLEAQVEDLTTQLNLLYSKCQSPKRNSNLSVNSFVKGV